LFGTFTLDNSPIGKSFPAGSLITQAGATVRPLDVWSRHSSSPHPFSTKTPPNAVIGAKSEEKELWLNGRRSLLEIVNCTSRFEHVK
jgi:hypothetical protein